MDSSSDDFLQQLRATFRVEAAEHLQTLSDGLLVLEKNGEASRGDAVERVFRAVHSLKGAARAVEFPQLEMLCQAFEEVMDAWKRGHAAPTPRGLDMLHKSLDAMAALLTAPGSTEPAGPAPPQVLALRRSLQQLAREKAALPGLPASRPVAAPAAPVIAAAATQTAAPQAVEAQAVEVQAAEARTVEVRAVEVQAAEPPRRTSVRVATAALESQLLQAEEMLAAKLATRERAADVSGLSARLGEWRRDWADMEADARILRQELARQHADPAARARLGRVLDFLDTGLDTLRAVETQAGAASRAANHDRHAVGKLVDDMLEQSKTLLLLPFSTVSASFAKLVRDLCHEQGKQAEFRLKGEDVKLEKHILEEIKDPLIHLLRNSVDHGVEAPGARQRAGKEAQARVALTVSRVDGNKVQIVLSDDGGGIDTVAVAASAVRGGVISAAEAAALSPAQAQALVFRSSISSNITVTRLSGRGLGLAIAREKVEALGGEILLESTLGQGTLFRILLPVTRATFRGILVEAAGQLLVVPTAQVERVGRASASQLSRVEGHDTLAIDGRAVPLMSLAHVLKLPPLPAPAARPGAAVPQPPPYFVIGSGERCVALSVDDVAGEQEVLVKPLRKPLSRVPNIAGTTILGSGRVAPVLNVPDLIKSAHSRPALPPATQAGASQAIAVRSILVAEDSITARMLLKAILESAGYAVTTAVDGVQAHEMLGRQPFDLLVSDVEMPRLDGFGLTARVRADPALAALPVILVTTLGSREDHERGMQAGANAYIVKGSFDQADLVETVRRLLG